MKLYDNGVYLVDGKKIIEDNQDATAAIKAETGKEISKSTR